MQLIALSQECMASFKDLHNWIIAYELIQIGLLTSVSLKLDQIVKGVDGR